jgi:UbiD family decarboxylase
MGTYRAALKAPDRMVVRMATRAGGAGGYVHYQKCQKLGIKRMPCAIVLGAPPLVAFVGPQKMPIGVDELDVAGGLAGAPINVIRAHSVDLIVPAEAEIVIEGYIDTEFCEPEAPFGESHGHVSLEEFNMPMRITAITHRRNPVVSSYISQVTPSESSLIKRVAYEPLYLSHLREALGIRAVKKVSFHEPLTGLRRILMVTLDKKVARTEIWRALYGAMSFKSDTGKICIAINDDIDPENADALWWAISYRANPERDIKIVSPRPRPWPQPRGWRSRRLRASHRCHHEGIHAAAGIAQKRIHGTRAGTVGRNAGRARVAAALAARALAWLFAGRLAAAVG